ncbi:MAG: prepilin-type N-terminal cleavage/methylation domain-containing protein [Firmicutes bacterium]|nr:prepilin-type N-terminal cleavage/methylation domain-containing protein [Bacillota bacterium]
MKNLFKMFKNENRKKMSLKKLDSKGMTLIEVVASMAILALVSIGVYNGTALILKGYNMGQFVYSSNGLIEQRIEAGTVPADAGSVSFKVDSTTVVVNGNFYTSSETRDDMEVTLSLFKP